MLGLGLGLVSEVDFLIEVDFQLEMTLQVSDKGVAELGCEGLCELGAKLSTAKRALHMLMRIGRTIAPHTCSWEWNTATENKRLHHRLVIFRITKSMSTVTSILVRETPRQVLHLQYRSQAKHFRCSWLLQNIIAVVLGLKVE